jgi:hypothetical protein
VVAALKVRTFAREMSSPRFGRGVVTRVLLRIDA